VAGPARAYRLKVLNSEGKLHMSATTAVFFVKDPWAFQNFHPVAEAVARTNMRSNDIAVGDFGRCSRRRHTR